jgi:hypothetical protein
MWSAECGMEEKERVSNRVSKIRLIRLIRRIQNPTYPTHPSYFLSTTPGDEHETGITTLHC